jgi:hypothetical protein
MKKASIVKGEPEETLVLYEEDGGVLLRRFEVREDGTCMHADMRLSNSEAEELSSLLRQSTEKTANRKQEEKHQQEEETGELRSPRDSRFEDRGEL